MEMGDFFDSVLYNCVVSSLVSETNDFTTGLIGSKFVLYINISCFNWAIICYIAAATKNRSTHLKAERTKEMKVWIHFTEITFLLFINKVRNLFTGYSAKIIFLCRIFPTKCAPDGPRLTAHAYLFAFMLVMFRSSEISDASIEAV